VREYSYVKKALLRELSENSRASVTELAKKLKRSRSTIISNMRSLEKELGLEYTIEFDKQAFGLVQIHLVKMRFGKKPGVEAIRRTFKNDDIAQLVAITEGDFDLFVRVVTDDTEKYVKWALETALKLLPYQPTLEPSMVAMVHTGFMQMPSEILKHMCSTVLGLDPLDVKILTTLNSNARTSYREMAKMFGEHVETVRYRIKKLMSMNLIRRFTVIAKKPPTDYNVAFFINLKLSPGLIARVREAQRYYESVDGCMNIINSFQFLALTSGSSLIFGVGCFPDEETAIKDVVLAHKRIYAPDQPIISFARIKQIIKGNPPIRNIDLVNN
jgi:Lrp/AsnC family leucine-responsive transcriptional regulator